MCPMSDQAAELTVSDQNCEPSELSNRLRDAVRAAGGAATVAKRAGLSPSSLSHYLNGREMKIGTAVALADACGVTLTWLATGAQAPTPGPAPHTEPYPAREPTLFGTLDMERLGNAVAAANAVFNLAGVEPPRRDLGRVTALLYDTPSLTKMTPRELVTPRGIDDVQE